MTKGGNWMKKWLIAGLLMLVFVLGACSQAAQDAELEDASASEKKKGAAETDGEKVPRVAFVYIGVPADGGWTKTHDEGRELVDKTFGITSTTVENVPEGPDSARIIEELAQNHDIVF